MDTIFYPKVTIVIPVYNGERYMIEAIDSALNQTYKNTEVLVVNDGSTDRTDEIAKSYGDRIVYIAKENGGVSTALNTGIERMTGRYFSWLSHDDKYLPGKIESQINVLQNLEDKTTVIYSGFQLIDGKSQVFDEIRLDESYDTEDLNKPLFALFHGHISGCTLLVEKSHFETVGCFDVQQKTTQDYDMWFRILRQSSIRYDKNCFVQSRIHPGQGTVTIPQHEDNCNKMWISFFEKITKEEMTETSGSPFLFFTDMYFVFMTNITYPKILEYIKNRYTGEYEKIIKNEKEGIIRESAKKIHVILLNFEKKSGEADRLAKGKTFYDTMTEALRHDRLSYFMLKILYKLKRIFSKR